MHVLPYIDTDLELVCRGTQSSDVLLLYVTDAARGQAARQSREGFLY